MALLSYQIKPFFQFGLTFTLILRRYCSVFVVCFSISTFPIFSMNTGVDLFTTETLHSSVSLREVPLGLYGYSMLSEHSFTLMFTFSLWLLSLWRGRPVAAGAEATQQWPELPTVCRPLPSRSPRAHSGLHREGMSVSIVSWGFCYSFQAMS